MDLVWGIGVVVCLSVWLNRVSLPVLSKRLRVCVCVHVCVCVRNACASVRVVRNTCMMCSVLASMINATALTVI